MAQAARKVNWFAIWVTAAVVIALVVVTVLVVSLNNAAAPKPLPTDINPPVGQNIDTETGAILVGSGEDRLDTYIDFMCPICGQFEEIYGAEIEDMVNDGSITLGIHPIAILDGQSRGTQFSTRAANAAYCVAAADPDAALPFLQAMFENQPSEGSSGLTNNQILGIASDVGVTGIDACVNDGTYAGFVGSMTAQTPIQPGSQGVGTPTVAVNGETIANSQLPGPGQLATLFE